MFTTSRSEKVISKNFMYFVSHYSILEIFSKSKNVQVVYHTRHGVDNNVIPVFISTSLFRHFLRDVTRMPHTFNNFENTRVNLVSRFK